MDIDESVVENAQQTKDDIENNKNESNEEAFDEMETDDIVPIDDSVSNEARTGVEESNEIVEDQQESFEGDEMSKETPDRNIRPLPDNQFEDKDIEKEDQNTSSNQEQPNSDTPAENAFGVDGESGKADNSSSRNEVEQSLKEIENKGSDNNNDNSRRFKHRGESTSNNNNESDKSEQVIENQNKESDQGPKDANPHRSLGDALEQWKRRLDDIIKGDERTSSQEQSPAQDSEQVINENQTFEFLENDEETHDLQTMGAAIEDQSKEIGAINNDEPCCNDANYAGEDDEIDYNQHKSEMSLDLLMNDHDYSNEHEKGAVLSKQILKQDENEQLFDEESNPQCFDSSRFAHEPLPYEEIMSLRHDLEVKLADWRQSGRDITKARELWHKYEILTHDLSNGLCEQLRLILEPTLATKLKGDYRTGKRLNMKKIIPYIASDFKKDKIWLRRTKPSKRQYQVMIAVDDSKSMCETRSIHLAYETLALISKALSQLEVGDISIISFGEKVQLLHPFDRPFSSEAGAQILQQFTFEQNKTYVRSLMETSITLLENARNNFSSGAQSKELWQLQLIISDGVCEDHENLKTLVRQAAESQIMVVFIIVDNKPGKDSIISMNQVRYKSVNGRMTIQMERYLDTFPFDYYVVLRDINALSETLADALRQYFSIISHNME
ncbi:5372_t:CDS:1 [Funneliformis mosseae]|uniref:5372_t:CDS:1 n=1 Tax=Funneliformis mosseae TaxID=27381 RepID=A0A9N8V1T6_FUNMO|nr:5372_t:CDS:1 [Funneliformis mosseae]